MGVWEDIYYADQLTWLKKHLAGSITCIKDGIAMGNMEMAREAWDELEDYQKDALWVAERNGGPFTHTERKIIKEGFKNE